MKTIELSTLYVCETEHHTIHERRFMGMGTVMKRVCCYMLAGLMLASVAAVAEAAPPEQVNFQGRLTDSSGTPLSGSYDFVIRFYDASSGGTLLLTDSHTSASGGAVTVDVGMYSVELGGGTITAGSESSLKSALANNGTVYIEIDVEGEALTPRTQLLSSGFAVSADSVDGYDASTSPGANEVPVVDASSNMTFPGDLTLTGGEIYLMQQATPSSTAEGTLYYDSDDDALLYRDNDSWETITRGGGVNQWTDSGTYIYPDNIGTGFQIQDDGDLSVSGNVGIRTTSPGEFLQVGEPALAQNVVVGLNAQSGNAVGIDFGSAGTTIARVYRPANSGDLRIWDESAGTDQVTFETATGYVGLGTTDPAAFLHLGSPTASETVSIIMDAAAAQQVGLGFYTAGVSTASLYRPNSSSDLRIWSESLSSDFVTFSSASGNVGIGTTSPQRPVHIAGNSGMRLVPSGTPASPIMGDICIDSGDGNTLKWHDGVGWRAADGSSDNDWTVSGVDLYSGVSGNVGIGTSIPKYFKLEVVGTIGSGTNNSGSIGTVTNMNTMDQDLGSVDASFWGEAVSDSSGDCVSGAGDVNGDGYDDILIGAPGNGDGGGIDAGQTYLIFGTASGWSMDTDLSAADASFWGEDGADLSGTSVSRAGDVNGDGYDDFLIGADEDDDGGTQAGQTYLIFGKASGWSMDTDLSDADASFWGEDASDYSGCCVSDAGDVNGDGYDDFLIGAYGDEDGGGANAGQTYLILGKPSGWSMDTDLSDADASFWGESADEWSGWVVSGAGDVNGDGYDDFLVGAREDDDGGSGAGQTYLILGKASGWSMDTDLSDADASFWGEDVNDYSGYSVSGAGDVNGDGYDDLVIGAYNNSEIEPGAGQAYLILGKASGWSMDTDLSDADASFIGEDGTDEAGHSVSGAGDVNGDGYGDFLISGDGDEEGGGDWAGQTYLILGRASGWAMDTDLSDADASFLGEAAGEFSGDSVAGVGDVNGDGYSDLLIGAPINSENGFSAGQTYLILSDELQYASIMARHIHAGDSLSVGNLKLQDETISSTSQLYLDANKVFVSGGLTVSGNVGIGTTTPEQRLEVDDVIRLEPQSSAPSNPSAGDMYFDSGTSKLRVYDGSTWRDCW